MKLLKGLTLFTFGGLAYGLVEIAWRGETHISMFLVGGLCFLVICMIDASPVFGGRIFLEAPFCALFITAAEFCSGAVVNLRLGLGVWDYSELPFNLMGQICLPFSGLWLLISIPAAAAGRWVRGRVFGERGRAAGR